MNKIKKGIFLVSLSGLTTLSTCGCIWQFKKYKLSTKRWEKINYNLKNYLPTPLNNLDYEKFNKKFFYR